MVCEKTARTAKVCRILRFNPTAVEFPVHSKVRCCIQFSIQSTRISGFLRMKLINRITDYLSGEVRQPKSIRLFSWLVYAWFLINALLTFPLRHQLWGNESLIAPGGFANNLVENFFYHLIYVPKHALAIYWIHILFVCLSFPERWWNFFPRFVVW